MTDWTETTLGELFRLGKRKSDPASLPADTPYVGLEHLVPDTSTVVSAGSAGGVSSAVAHFEPGDVLFGRLRPYLRKVALAEVAGVCSPEVLVLRPTEAVVPKFLYLLAASEASIASAVAASAGSRMPRVAAADIGALPVSLPAIHEQRRIVAVVDAIDCAAKALAVEHAALERTYGALADTVLWSESDGSEAERRTLGSVMGLDVERVTLEKDQTYRLAGVLNAGGGIIDKGSILGAQTEYVAMNVLREGRAVMRKLTAWEGPITVVDEQYDGYVASTEFPTFALHGVSPDYFRHVCRSPRLWAEMRQRVTGSVQRRKRLNPDQLLAVELTVPRSQGERRATAALDATEAQVVALSAEVERLRATRSRVVEALLAQEITADEAADQFIDTAREVAA